MAAKPTAAMAAATRVRSPVSSNAFDTVRSRALTLVSGGTFSASWFSLSSLLMRFTTAATVASATSGRVALAVTVMIGAPVLVLTS